MADFEAVAAAALARAETLIPQLLPGGKRSGSEWVCGSLQGGPGRSFSVNFTTGAFADFSTDNIRGGDLISLYAAIHGLSQSQACEELAKQMGLNGYGGPPRIAAPKPTERPADPIPDEAGDPPVHPDQTALYWYHNAQGQRLFAICRLESGEGKSFRQWTRRAGKWTPKAYPAPRPLYRLPELARLELLPVLVVEGEKCADAASALPGYVAVSWAGGAQAAKTADWSALTDRDVVLWPDADKPGIQAMVAVAQILLPIVSTLRIVKPGDVPQGWDIADAIAAHIEPEAFIRDHVQDIADPVPAVQSAPKQKKGRPRSGPPPIDHEDPGPTDPDAPAASSFVSWQSMGLECNAGGVPFPSLANVHVILRTHPTLTNKVWFDDFRGKIMFNSDTGTRPWTDADDLALVDFIQSDLKISKIGLQTAMHGVQRAAFANRRNSVTQWLDGLTWDGIERLEFWTADCLGVDRTPYSSAVGRNWIVSMVARAYRPGCQADHMPVLEGAMGRGKSSAIAILGGEWYRAAPQAFGSKEFLEVIQGAWLIEIPDMVGFGKREHTQIISAITTRSDSYRASYGRHSEDHPRTCVFAATSETDDYLQDSRGIRRYWPLRCGDIELPALISSRDQLFAEAVQLFKAGATWHEMPADATAEEQAARLDIDPWMASITAWVKDRPEVLSEDVILLCLGIETKMADMKVKMRVAKCLKALGYETPKDTTLIRGQRVRPYRKLKTYAQQRLKEITDEDSKPWEF